MLTKKRERTRFEDVQHRYMTGTYVQPYISVAIATSNVVARGGRRERRPGGFKVVLTGLGP